MVVSQGFFATMLGGYRHDGLKPSSTSVIATVIGCAIIVAMVLAIAWGFSEKVKYEREAQERHENYAARSYYSKRESCFQLRSIDQINCLAQADHEARENERGEQDLVAQKTTAIWTVLMGGAAVAGVVLSIVGVILVWTTFNATRAGNEIAKKNARTQLAASVYLSSAQLTMSDRAVKAVIFLKNFGDTEARDLEVTLDIDGSITAPPNPPAKRGEAFNRDDVIRVDLSRWDQKSEVSRARRDDRIGLVPRRSKFKMDRFERRNTQLTGVTKRLRERKFVDISFSLSGMVSWIDSFGERHSRHISAFTASHSFEEIANETVIVFRCEVRNEETQEG